MLIKHLMAMVLDVMHISYILLISMYIHLLAAINNVVTHFDIGQNISYMAIMKH